MSIATLFQKHGTNRAIRILKTIYIKLFLRTNNSRIKYLRDSGAKIGNNVTIHSISILGTEPYLVGIGDNVYISGSDVRIITHDGSIMQLKYMGLTDKKYDIFGKVKIGDNCFIGTKSVILRNVNIGKNCIIGAGSVVTKDIPDGSVACGIPAKVIGTVEDFYKKNQNNFEDTFTFNQYQKRMYLEKKYNCENV